MSDIKILKDPAEVARWVAESFATDVQGAISATGSAVWVAAGGSTPAAVYSLLRTDYSDLPWRDLRILMGDERCVAPDAEDSNWRQLYERLLSHLEVPEASQLRPRAEYGAESAADDYGRVIGQLAVDANGRPRLDHVWLGMGEDGHTLSLFPDHPAAGIRDRLAVAVHDSPKPPPDRVTLTYEALKGTVHALVLATGGGKRDVVARAIAGDRALPVAEAAAVIEQSGGAVTWVLDDAAASNIAT